jgi:hypothetical protein
VDRWDYSSLPESLDKLTKAENIRRVRQKIQNDLGLFPPTDPDVIAKRKIKEEVIKEWAVMEKDING